MIELLKLEPTEIRVDRAGRYAREPSAIFLHPPAPDVDANAVFYSSIAIKDEFLFECQLSLPTDSAQTRFIFSLMDQEGNVVLEWTRQPTVGKMTRCRERLDLQKGFYTFSIQTRVLEGQPNNSKAWARIHEPRLIGPAEVEGALDPFHCIATNEDHRFATADPWSYEQTPDDLERRNKLLSIIPFRTYRRTLEIGCGDGFLTFSLPGAHLTGVDISDRAIQHIRHRKEARERSCEFHAGSFHELPQMAFERFDLIVIAGVLYPHYVGRDSHAINEVIGSLLAPGGILVTCHIVDWMRHQIALCRVNSEEYSYRQFRHHLEVYTDYDTHLS
ncbi:class I SAM-dependent methyltransferase [Kordiimonas gwangyangensis]|uniref:class I SAM-dependent methyltransferase n=1 Tax=Kordiimonas gwangyangensis TaxID=288022 RepID=UPI00036807B4|nr:class I SAM-dependent methyltransferase [Kordiimonas gwangyangensis]